MVEGDFNSAQCGFTAAYNQDVVPPIASDFLNDGLCISINHYCHHNVYTVVLAQFSLAKTIVHSQDCATRSHSVARTTLYTFPLFI